MSVNIVVTAFLSILCLMDGAIGYNETAHRQKVACMCSRKYDPVCGTDGKTYSNSCTLQCEMKACEHSDLDLGCVGQCPCKCNCERYSRPICGSDDITYNNLCRLHCARRHHKKWLTVKHDGLCGSCPDRFSSNK